MRKHREDPPVQSEGGNEIANCYVQKITQTTSLFYHTSTHRYFCGQEMDTPETKYDYSISWMHDVIYRHSH